MAELRIDQEICIGCGSCVSACVQGAMIPRQPVPMVGDGCIFCGICAENCPVGAISIERAGAGKYSAQHMDTQGSGEIESDFCRDQVSGHEGLTGNFGSSQVYQNEETVEKSHSGIWIFAERNSSVPASVVYELLTCGRRLADEKGCTLTAIWPGDYDAAKELIAAGADQVIFCKDERLHDNLEEPYREFLLNVILEFHPEILLFGATPFGRSIAPRLAAALKTGLTADCTELSIDAETGLLRQTRPAFGGNLMATILCPVRRPQMATVRPGVMKAGERDYGRVEQSEAEEVNQKERVQIKEPKILEWQLPVVIPGETKLLEVIEKAASESIADAEILVVAGRGIGSRKNLKLVYELAELLGAKVGCSRPLVDSGWCEYPHQVGQTGCSVAPKLLISFGVSGAIQHLAGIGQAETIIAINSDPEAPIFGVSHYKVEGDCVEVMKEMIRLQKLRRTAV